MKVLENIRNKIGRWQLDREVSGKKPGQLIPFGEMQHIGILYDAEWMDSEAVVLEYANALKAEGRKVFMMGFVNQKQLPPTKKFVLNSEFFWKDKLNGVNLPLKGNIGIFLEQEFDLLLNLYFEPQLPLQAMSAYSKARYKVGSHIDGGLKYGDAMIDIGTNRDLRFLIEQIDFYLKAIK
jgi:hypothetical protein